MYCKNCGKELNEKYSVCLNCGVPIEGNQVDKNEVVNENNNVTNKNDKGGFLWGLLGFFVPLVGLILFLVWRESKPKTAKSVGKGALVNVILGVILMVITIVASMIMIAGSH